MSSQAVIVERHGRVAVLRLNQPESRNALSPQIKEGLETNVPLLLADPDVRVVLITGTDGAFCAGGDLRTMQGDLRAVASRARMKASHSWVGALLTTDKMVVTAVNGPAAGAGLALALLGDIILAADDAYFQAGFTGVGVVPDYGLGLTLPRAVGVPRAKDMLLTNRKVEAAEAFAMGLVTRLVPASELRDAALKQAERLAGGPSYAFGATKGLINRGFEDSIEAFLEREAFAQGVAFESDDRAAGVDAFLNKKRPVFG